MKKIQQKGYAKINVGLDVVRRMENGYHEVKMIMQTLSLCDLITIEKKEEKEIEVYTNKSELPGNEDNLVYKAAKLLIDECKISEGVIIHLEKNIPIAAGLAGGSTDAAAVFRGMNELFDLGLSVQKMQELAVKLGADIPYCITGGTYLSEGIGEKLSVVSNMPKCFVLLAKPDIAVSTKWVYENLHANELKKHPDIDGIKNAMESNNLYGMCEKLENVLETVTVTKYPIIQEIKRIMKENGAINAIMSGSGPTVFGVFDNEQKMADCHRVISELGLAKEIYETTVVGGY